MSLKTGTLIKTMSSKIRLDNGEQFDSILLIYRDKNGEKKKIFTDRAEIPYYVIKDKNSKEAENPPLFIERDKVQKYTTFSDQIYRDMATKANIMNVYSQIQVNSGHNAYSMKNLFKHKYFYDSDMDPEDRYIANFYEEFESDPDYELHKTFFDIEVDLMPDGWKKNKDGSFGYIGFPEEEEAPVPINIITLLDDKVKKIYTFVVRNKLNESLNKFEKNVESFKATLRNELTDKGYEPGEIQIEFYDSEVDAILRLFKVNQKIDPDFSFSWNSSFDIQTMLNRLLKAYTREYGRAEARQRVMYDLSDERYLNNVTEDGREVELYPYLKYNARKNLNFADRFDTFFINDGINWVDQMLAFANIRKTSGMRESYALDAIAEEEIGRQKLEFEPGETIKTLAWTNFEKFALYNIIDVVLLAQLEHNNNDAELLQRLSEITNTRIERVFAKTVSIKNFMSKFAKDNNFIMTNNRNARYGDYSETFDRIYLNKGKTIETDRDYQFYFDLKDNYGGFVGDPNLNSSVNGAIINNRPSRFLYNYVFDLDYSSLYPSIIRAFNIDTTTLVGKYYMVDNKLKSRLVEEFDYDGVFDMSVAEAASRTYKPGEIDEDGNNIYDGTGELVPSYIDSLHSQDFIRTGEKFYDLPSTEELMDQIDKKINGRQ